MESGRQVLSLSNIVRCVTPHDRWRRAPLADGARRYRRSGPLLAALCALVLVAGCASPRPSGRTEIVYWTGWSGAEFDVQKRLVDEFNRTHPNVRVRMLCQMGNSGYQKVRIAFAGGATPDVMSTVWAEEFASYAMRGVLTPLDGFMRRSGRDLDREFVPGFARMLRVEGHVYGLAATNDTTFVAFNRQIFREAGLDPARPPRTLDELDAAAKACTEYDRNGNFRRYGFQPGGLQLWAYVFGGGWVDPVTHRVTANAPANIAALTWMASYARHYDLKKMQAFQTTFGSNTTPNGPFYVGKVAMEVTGEWERDYVARYAPKLDWGWFALPAPPGGRRNTTLAGGSIFVIPAACKQKEAAWEFVNWFTSPHAVKEFGWGIKNLPPLIAVMRDPVYQSDPLYRFTTPIAAGQNSFGPPPIPIWTTYAREIGRVEEAALLGGGDPKRLLDDLQRRMEKELAETIDDLHR
jgi:multiple sugar transport system substrate-binding protein